MKIWLKHGKKDFLLFTAVTLHNFPEGLAVGVAFGALASNPDIQTLVGAMLLTLGIGIQNIPEGAAISLPLRRGNVDLIKCFNYGQMSGLVEIVGGLMGAYAVYSFTRILPFALAFSAGAMIYVSIEQLIPEAKRKDIDNKVPSIFGVIGFTLMMFLDVSLGWIYPNFPLIYSSVLVFLGLKNSSSVGLSSSMHPLRKNAVLSDILPACCMLWVTMIIV